MPDFEPVAASVAAESTPAPTETSIAEEVVAAPSPISAEGSTPEHVEKAAPKVDEPKPSASAREAIEKAMDTVKAKASEVEAAKAEAAKTADQAKAPKKDEIVKPGKVDGETATVAKVEPSKHAAPERFSPDAKAAWETAPEPVKAEVHRAIKELQQGHEKYKADAEAFDEVREYHDLAKKHGTSVKDALTRYTGLERQLGSADPSEKAAAIASVLEYAGVTPQQYAAFVSGQPQSEPQQRHDQMALTHRQEIASLRQHIDNIQSALDQQRHSEINSIMDKFAETHPRFDELGESMEKLITSGLASDLSEAYEKAERLNPSPHSVSAKPTPTPTIEDLKAQTLKGSKSVAGAPSSGSDPSKKGKPSATVREAIIRARSAL